MERISEMNNYEEQLARDVVLLDRILCHQLSDMDLKDDIIRFYFEHKLTVGPSVLVHDPNGTQHTIDLCKQLVGYISNISNDIPEEYSEKIHTYSKNLLELLERAQ